MSVYRWLAAYISPHSTLRKVLLAGPALKPALSLQATPLLQAQRLSTNARVIDSGKKLSLDCSGDVMRFHTVWLRHNCHCDQCLSSSGQKIMSFESLCGDLKITSAEVQGDKLVVSWTNRDGGHAGFLPIKWLKENNYAAPNFSREKHTKRQPLIASHLPKLTYKEVMETEEGLWRWLRDLNHYGMCLLFGAPAECGNVQKLGRRISHLQRNVYGETFDLVASESPGINIAYTSEGIPFHMDLLYYQSPAGVQLLHCVKFDECVEGGESILLDTYPVVEEMRRKYPKQFDTLTRVPATFETIPSDRENFEMIFLFQRPHIVLNRDQKVVAVNWEPVNEGTLHIPEHQVEEYFDAYTLLAQMFKDSPLALTHRLQPGEVLTFNNHRLLHGRLPFTLRGGVRHLEGCYINIDEFKSRFVVVSRRLGKHNEPVKHVFNECWDA